MLAVVVVCAIVGDSVGYAVGERWGPKLLELGPLRKRQKGLDAALDQLNRRGPVAVFVARFSAFLRAVVPGLAGLSSMHYRTFLGANAAGGLCWGVLYVLLGYFVGQSVEKATGIASDVVLGLILVVIVVLVVRHCRREKRGDRGSVGDGGTRRSDAAGLIRPARPEHRAVPGAEARPRPGRTPPPRRRPSASVSMKRTAAGSLRSTPKRP